MKTTDEFGNAGKEMPYSVPDGFFERITGETLQKASQRSAFRRKKIKIRVLTGIAASLLLLIAAGIALLQSSSRLTPPVTADSVKPAGDHPVQDTPTLPTTIPSVSDKRNLLLKKDGQSPANDVEHKISLAELLASLSDEELLLMAARFDNDLFLNEKNDD